MRYPRVSCAKSGNLSGLQEEASSPLSCCSNRNASLFYSCGESRMSAHILEAACLYLLYLVLLRKLIFFFKDVGFVNNNSNNNNPLRIWEMSWGFGGNQLSTKFPGNWSVRFVFNKEPRALPPQHLVRASHRGSGRQSWPPWSGGPSRGIKSEFQALQDQVTVEDWVQGKEKEGSRRTQEGTRKG